MFASDAKTGVAMETNSLATPICPWALKGKFVNNHQVLEVASWNPLEPSWCNLQGPPR